MADIQLTTAASTPAQRIAAESPVRPREIVQLICWLLLCGGLVHWRSFHLPYGFDDIAHLHALAAYRSGEITFTQWLLLNHNEHFVPLLRLYFMLATKISGLSAAAIHVLIFLNYIVGAFACAWIAFSLTRSRLAAFLAGTIYAGAAGFAGSIVWQPTDGQFAVAGTPLIVAIAVLVSPYARKRWTDVAVLVLIFLSAMGMGGISVASLAIPLYLLLAKPDTMTASRRKLMIVLSVSLTGAILLATKWLMKAHHIGSLEFAVKGIYDGLFLIFSSGGRFLLAWTPFDEFKLPIDIAVSAIGWGLILLTFRLVPKSLRKLLLALWVGNGLLALLIGMGRYKITNYLDLFTTDRYHYFFLLPLALQAAAVLDRAVRRLLEGASRARKMALGGALFCLLAAALVMSNIRVKKQMDVLQWVIVQHRQEFREVKVLAKMIRKKAATQHLHLAEGPIRFEGPLNVHMGLSCIIYTQFPKGLPNIEWTLNKVPTTSVGSPWDVPPISEADAAVENQILDEWYRRIKREPYSCMINGKMQDVLPVPSCAEAAKMSPPPLAPPRRFW